LAVTVSDLLVDLFQPRVPTIIFGEGDDGHLIGPATFSRH
jgi:hypothetical protein